MKLSRGEIFVLQRSGQTQKADEMTKEMDGREEAEEAKRKKKEVSF